MEFAFMIAMGAVIGSLLTIAVVALVLTGIRGNEWPVLRRKRTVYRGFHPR
ncbi:hypothetical protein ACWGH8_29140 [Nonomuraea muscovyensis]